MPVGLEKRALALIGELIGLLDLDEFCDGLLHALRQAVPSDWSALNEVPADHPYAISLTEPPIPAEKHQLFARHAAENPIAEHFLRTGDGRATRFSDLLTRRELHRLEIYRQLYGPIEIEYQIAFTIPSRTERILGVALSRRRSDFTARERDLLNLARPYLIQLYRNALAHAEHVGNAQLRLPALMALGLTRRQAQVLWLVANGHSGKQTAAKLGMSPRTAQKHLELCYRTLEVSTQAEATGIAWSAGASSSEG